MHFSVISTTKAKVQFSCNTYNEKDFFLTVAKLLVLTVQIKSVNLTQLTDNCLDFTLVWRPAKWVWELKLVIKIVINYIKHEFKVIRHKYKHTYTFLLFLLGFTSNKKKIMSKFLNSLTKTVVIVKVKHIIINTNNYVW